MAAEKRQRVSDPLEAIAELAEDGPRWLASLGETAPMQPAARGSFGAVFFARMRGEDGDTYAVKVQPETNKYLNEELAMLRAMSGDGVGPRLHAAFTATGAEVRALLDTDDARLLSDGGWGLSPTKLYRVFVQERLETTLYNLYEYNQTPGRAAFERYRRHMRELVDLVRRMHARGWAHGDVHDSNVMVSKDGRVRLIDFGNGVRAPPEGAVDYWDAYGAAKQRDEDALRQIMSSGLQAALGPAHPLLAELDDDIRRAPDVERARVLSSEPIDAGP